MDTPYPILNNILSLGEPDTWQHGLDMGSASVSCWLAGIKPRDIRRICFIGCGTSHYAAQVAKYVVEHIAHIPAEAMQAWAFATYAEPAVLGQQTLVVGISATGESDAVCDALTRARNSGALTLAITANPGSSVARSAGASIVTGGEDDRILVKTKSYVLSLVAVYLLAAALAEARGAGSAESTSYWRAQIIRAAEGTRRILDNQQPEIEQIAKAYAQVSMVFVIGSGPNAGTIQEGALKIIEMAKMYSEAQELEDFMHGRFREVDTVNPMVFVAPQGRASRRVLDFLTITRHIGVPTVVLTDHVSQGIKRLATHIMQMPVTVDEMATPLLYITPLHLLAHQLAVVRGWDPLSRRYEDIVPQQVRYNEREG